MIIVRWDVKRLATVLAEELIRCGVDKLKELQLLRRLGNCVLVPFWPLLGLKLFALFLQNALSRFFGKPCTNNPLDCTPRFVLGRLTWRECFLPHRGVRLGSSWRA